MDSFDGFSILHYTNEGRRKKEEGRGLQDVDTGPKSKDKLGIHTTSSLPNLDESRDVKVSILLVCISIHHLSRRIYNFYYKLKIRQSKIQKSIKVILLKLVWRYAVNPSLIFREEFGKTLVVAAE